MALIHDGLVYDAVGILHTNSAYLKISMCFVLLLAHEIEVPSQHEIYLKMIIS